MQVAQSVCGLRIVGYQMIDLGYDYKTQTIIIWTQRMKKVCTKLNVTCKAKYVISNLYIIYIET